MEDALINATKPYTCRICQRICVRELVNRNPFDRYLKWTKENPPVHMECLNDITGGVQAYVNTPDCAINRLNVGDWINVVFYDALGLSRVHVDITVRLLTQTILEESYEHLDKLVWLTSRLFCVRNISIQEHVKFVGVIERLVVRHPNLSIDDIYDIYVEERTTAVNGFVAYDSKFINKVTERNNFKINPLWEPWEMDTTMFTHIIQWLPREMIDDMGVLLKRPFGAETRVLSN